MQKFKQVLIDAVLLIIKILKAPLNGINTEQNLTWSSILTVYGLLAFVSAFINNIFVGNIFYSIPYSITDLIRTSLIHAVILCLLFFILQKTGQKLEFIKLVEIWAISWIPSTAASIILYILLFTIPAGLLFTTLIKFIPALVFVVFLYMGLSRLKVPLKAKLWFCLILIFVFALIYYQSVKILVEVDNLNKKTKEVSNVDNGQQGSELPVAVTKYAEEHYSNEPKKKAAFLQYARALNAIVNSSFDRDVLDEMESKAVECSGLVFGYGKGIGRLLKPLVLDTSEKVKAYIAWNKSFSGKILHDKTYGEDACEK